MAAPSPHADGAVASQYSNLEVVPGAPDSAGLQVDHSAYPHGKFQPVPVTSYVGPEPKQWVEHDPNSPPNAHDNAGYAPETVPAYYNPGDAGRPELHGNALPPPPPPPPTICGIGRKKFWIIAGVLLVIVAAAVGGGVGGALANRSSAESAKQANSGGTNSGSNSGSGAGSGSGSGSGSNSTTAPPIAVQDMSIAAIGWETTTGVRQYRVYHQPANQSNLFESKWVPEEKAWQLEQITQSTTQSVKRGTPLAAMIGYPHANNTHFKLTKTIYFQEPGGVLIERNSQDTFPGQWSPAGFSTRATGSTNSSIFAYLYTNLTDPDLVLSVFYQDSGAGSITVARYGESAKRGIYIDWVATKQNIDVAAGSPIAAAPAGRLQDLRLYVTKGDGTLMHFPYDVERNSLGEGAESKVKIPPKTPLCVLHEDNSSRSTLPTCARGESGAFLTHLILYATPDRQGLRLLTWECDKGFVEQQSRIEKLLKPGRTYLALSAAIPATGSRFEGQRVYVLFDEGKGPLIEEWEVPSDGGAWKVLGGVPHALQLS